MCPTEAHLDACEGHPQQHDKSWAQEASQFLQGSLPPSEPQGVQGLQQGKPDTAAQPGKPLHPQAEESLPT